MVSGSQVDKEVEKEVDKVDKKVDKNADKEVNPDILPVPRRLPADRLLFPPGKGFLPFRARSFLLPHTSMPTYQLWVGFVFEISFYRQFSSFLFLENDPLLFLQSKSMNTFV